MRPAAMVPPTRQARIHELEMQLQSHVHGIDLVIKDEELRRLKASNLILCHEIASLQDRVAQRDASIKNLTSRHDNTKTALEASQKACREHEKTIRRHERDVLKLKVSGLFIYLSIYFLHCSINESQLTDGPSPR